MWQNKQSELLRGEMETLLDSLSDFAYLSEFINESLAKSRGLSVETEKDRLWRLLPIIVCEAISGNYKRAMPAAAAIQLFKAAAEVFDDIEDADSSDSLFAKYGLPIAVNTATLLLILAEKAITRLKKTGVADGMIVSIMDKINSYYIQACTGQHLDIYLSPSMKISEDTYLRVAAMKSASQVECACYIGALLSMANQNLINLLSSFGHNLGMASQIANDVQGILQGKDIIKRRITLPMIYALTETESKITESLKSAFFKRSEDISNPGQVRDILFNVGAIQYATIKMELYKQRALDTLLKAEEERVNISRLMLFFK